MKHGKITMNGKESKKIVCHCCRQNDELIEIGVAT